MQLIFLTIKKGYDWLAGILDYLRSPLLLAMRFYWGWQFFLTGKGKLMNLDRVAAFFSDLGIPLPKLNAILAGSTELFGGLLLLLGLASRLVTIPLAITMTAAYLAADRDAVKDIFSDPDKFVTADPFLFLLTAVIVMAFGPGLFSIDRLIKWRVEKWESNKNSRENVA